MSKPHTVIGWLGALALSVLALSATPALADDPPPSDGTLRTHGVGGSGVYVASQEAWEDALSVVYSIFPDADYNTAAYYIVVWFNMVSPDEYIPIPPAPEDAPPPDNSAPPVPHVATQQEWDDATWFVTSFFYPDIDAATLAQLLLDWYLLLPPE